MYKSFYHETLFPRNLLVENYVVVGEEGMVGVKVERKKEREAYRVSVSLRPLPPSLTLTCVAGIIIAASLPSESRLGLKNPIQQSEPGRHH